MPRSRVPVIRGTGGLSVQVEGLDEVYKDLAAIARNGEQTAPIHSAVALVVRGWQVRHFDKAEDSKGVPWPPLAPLTRALRRGGGAKPLQDTGQTKASIHVMNSNDQGWTVGTRRRFMAMHQTGMTSKGETVIKPVKGEFLFIGVNSRGGKARSFGSSVEMGGKRGERYGKLTKSGKAKRRLIAIRQARIVKREFIYLNLVEQGDMVEVYASELAVRGTTYIKWSRVRRARA